MAAPQSMERQRPVPLYLQIFKEADAMAKYALASGLNVPSSSVQAINDFAFQMELDGPRRDSPEVDTADTSAETRALPATPAPDLRRLVLAHERLAQIVAPATPRSVVFLAEETSKKGLGQLLGSVSVLRRMIAASTVFLLLFIGLSLTKYVNANPESGNIYETFGVQLLIVQLFYLSAAGIGATFAALFQANSYVVKGTFDPKYRFSYWIKIALGIIAGFILAQLIPVEDQSGAMEVPLGKPTLAMVGGFSATLVYRILSRLVEALESLFRGETKTLVAAQEQVARARAMEAVGRSRLSLAAHLMNVQKQLGAGVDQEKLQQQLSQLLEELVPLDLEPAVGNAEIPVQAKQETSPPASTNGA